MAVPVVTAQSPVAGSISWQAFNIQYMGVSYAIPGGNTANRWVWWRYNGGGAASTIEAGPDIPSNLTDDDILLLGNKNGLPIRIQSTNTIDGDLIVDGTVLAKHLGADSVVASKIAGGTITAEKFAATLILAAKLIVDRISLSKEDGLKIDLDTGVIQFPSDGSAATIYADLVAFSLTIMDSLNVRGANNYIAGLLTAASGITDPKTPPTLSNSWPARSWSPFFNILNSQAICRPHEAIGPSMPAGSFRALTVQQVNGVETTQIWTALQPDTTAAGYTSATPATERLDKTLFTATTEPNWEVPGEPNKVQAAVLAFNGSNYFLLLRNKLAGTAARYKIRKYDTSWNFVADSAEFLYSDMAATQAPTIGVTSDNNVVMCYRPVTTSSLVSLKFQVVNAGTLAFGSTVSGTASGGSAPIFVDGSKFPGVYMVKTYTGEWDAFTTAGARDAASIFAKSIAALGATASRLMVSSFAAESYMELDMNHTRLRYSGGRYSGTVYAGYTWYDSTADGDYGAGGESKISPIKSHIRARGAMVAMSIPVAPDGGDPDDPDARRIYLGETAATVGLQGHYVLPTDYYFDTFVSPSSGPPGESAFAGRLGALGRLKSALPGWDFWGDGTYGVDLSKNTVKLPGFAAYIDTAQPLTTSGYNSVTGWTEEFDYGGGFNPGTGMYVVPATGEYEIAAALLFNTSTVGRRFIQIERGTAATGSNTPLIRNEMSADAGYTGPTVYRRLMLQAGDTLRLAAYQTSGGTLTHRGDFSPTTFSVRQVA